MLGDDDPVTVQLRVDADHADGALAELRRRRRPSPKTTRRHRRRRARRSRTAPRSARSCSGFLDHAEVLAPPDIRADIVAWLEQTRGAGAHEPAAVAGPEIQRILALVPWIVAHPGTPKAEIAQRFGISVGQLDEDLALVLMIGVPPYSPGDYLDVEEDDDGGRDDPPRRLLPPPVATHARRRPRAARRRARLARRAGLGSRRSARDRARQARSTRSTSRISSSTSASPKHLDAIRDAVHHHERIEIDYWSAGRDELTTRGRRPRRRVLRARGLVRRARTATGPRPTGCSESTGSVGSGRREQHFDRADRRPRRRARSTTRRPTTRGSRSASHPPRRGSPRRIRPSR